LGHSSCHAGNVPLVYNPTSTHVTPQYHIVFNEGFTSTNHSTSDVSAVNLKDLHDSVTWLHSVDTNGEDQSTYYFDSFWMDPLIKHTLPKCKPFSVITKSKGAPANCIRFPLPSPITHLWQMVVPTQEITNLPFPLCP
jgi:hypothetical protein